MSIENAKLLLALAKLEADRQVERIASARSHLTPPHLVAKMETELAELRQQMVDAGTTEDDAMTWQCETNAGYRLAERIEQAVKGTLAAWFEKAKAEYLTYGQATLSTVEGLTKDIEKAIFQTKKNR